MLGISIRKVFMGLCGAVALMGGAATSGLADDQTAGLDDAAIFAIYDQVNGFDIETASLGAVKGDSEDVRALAVMVLRDHSAVRQMTRDLAGNLGVAYEVDGDNASAKNHAAALAALEAKSGAAFDAAYLRHETEFHRAAIEAVKTVLIPNIEGPELKSIVVTVLPGFEHHLAETRRVADKLGVE
jgi:putative membrane protein